MWLQAVSKTRLWEPDNDDALTGTVADDVIIGGLGDDTVDGGAGYNVYEVEGSA